MMKCIHNISAPSGGKHFSLETKLKYVSFQRDQRAPFGTMSDFPEPCQHPRCEPAMNIWCFTVIAASFRSLRQWTNINLTIRNKTRLQRRDPSTCHTRRRTIHNRRTICEEDFKHIYICLDIHAHSQSKFKDKSDCSGVVYCANKTDDLSSTDLQSAD